MKNTMKNTTQTKRRTGTALGFGLMLALVPSMVPLMMPSMVHAAPAPAKNMNALGPENGQMAKLVGTWDVVETSWDGPNAAPRVSKAVAERRMIGSFLQEILRPSPGSPQVLRMDYLSFNRVEGRWKYVSMETRAPVGIMSAASFGRGQKGRIDVTFEPFSLPGSGQLLQMNQTISAQNVNRDRKDQRFVVADGSGKMWLGHRYDYTRRQTKTK